MCLGGLCACFVIKTVANFGVVCYQYRILVEHLFCVVCVEKPLTGASGFSVREMKRRSNSRKG